MDWVFAAVPWGLVLVPHEGATLTPEDVIAFCEGQIAHFNVPKHMRIVDDMPMTVTRKPQKFVMREWMVREGVWGVSRKSEPYWT